MARPYYIADLDGTVSDDRHRHQYLAPVDVVIDYERFHPTDAYWNAMIDDRPMMPVVNVIRALKSSGFDIVFLTGRLEQYRELTEQWLRRHIGNWATRPLYMRKHSGVKDFAEKRRVYIEEIRPSFGDALGVFEDRPRVVRMWRELGLTVFQMTDIEF